MVTRGWLWSPAPWIERLSEGGRLVVITALAGMTFCRNIGHWTPLSKSCCPLVLESLGDDGEGSGLLWSLPGRGCHHQPLLTALGMSVRSPHTKSFLEAPFSHEMTHRLP